MRIYQLINIVVMLLFSSTVLAASGDSVMTAPTSTTAPSMSYKAATASSGNVYSYTYTTQYQTATCPAGLTANGSSIYNSAQRQIVYTYLGSQLVGFNTTAWTDIDTDCSGSQTQIIACPAGYNGSITQQRKVGTASNGDGSLQYDPWVTTTNTCVKIPTPKPGYTVLITKDVYAYNEQNWYLYQYTLAGLIDNQTGKLVCGKTVNGILNIGTEFSDGLVGCQYNGDNLNYNSQYECYSSAPCGQGDNGPAAMYYQTIVSSRSADNCQITLRIYTNAWLMLGSYLPYQVTGEYMTFNICQ